MRFSIIIPTLNEAPGIQDFLSGLQTYRRDSELILVDGGSSDGTTELATPLVDKVLLSKPGRARQMNHGAESATGDVLIFLHADTYLPANALELIATNLSETRHWGRFDVQLTGKPVMLKVIAFLMNRRSRLTGIATGDQVIFVKREVFVNLGGFPEIALMEDIAFSKALKKISKPICLRDKVTSSGRRWERFGVFQTIVLMWWLRGCFACGVHPDKLAAIYAKGRLWKRD